VKGVNTDAYLIRMEMYVPEHNWKQSSIQTKFALSFLIDSLEDRMAPVLKRWNLERANIHDGLNPSDKFLIASLSYDETYLKDKLENF
jgi:hypothetical protein